MFNVSDIGSISMASSNCREIEALSEERESLNISEETGCFHSERHELISKGAINTGIEGLLGEKSESWLKQHLEKLLQKNKELQIENERLHKLVDQNRTSIKPPKQFASVKDGQNKNIEATSVGCAENSLNFSSKSREDEIKRMSQKIGKKLITSLRAEIHDLKLEVPDLKTWAAVLDEKKKDLEIKYIHERLDQKEQQKRTINTMQRAIYNLTDYIASLELEIYKLKSIKGINENAPVFNPLFDKSVL